MRQYRFLDSWISDSCKRTWLLNLPTSPCLGAKSQSLLANESCPLKPQGLSRLLSPCFLWISQQLINMFHAQCALLLVYLCITDSLTFRFLPACRRSGTIPKWAHEAKEYWTTEHVIHIYVLIQSIRGTVYSGRMLEANFYKLVSSEKCGSEP